MIDGSTYDAAKDGPRLRTQLERVKNVLVTTRLWFTLSELTSHCGGSEAGVSARIRDLRKSKHGAHTVERRRRKGLGTWEYRVVPPVVKPKQGRLW